MKKLEINNYSVEDLLALLRSNSDYLVGVRLLALIQIAKGKSSRDLEDIFDKSHSRFCVWVNNFNEYGLEGIKDKSGRGRNSKLSEIELAELKNVVLNKSPEEYGYNTATWNGLLLIDFISNKYHVSYKKANIYVILKQKLGLSFQKGKGFYPEQDKEKREEHKNIIKKTLRTKNR